MFVSPYLSFLVNLTCGNGILSPNCNLCPKNGDTITNSWCSGNCYYDENDELCKQGIFGSSDWSQHEVTYYSKGFAIFIFHINICWYSNSDEYESIENQNCENTSHDNGFTTLIESKAECSSRSDCFGIVTNGFFYKFCTFPDSIINQDNGDDSSILEPIIFHAKLYHSGIWQKHGFKSANFNIVYLS